MHLMRCSYCVSRLQHLLLPLDPMTAAAVRQLLSKSIGRSADVRGLYLYTARQYFPHCSFDNEFSEDDRKKVT